MNGPTSEGESLRWEWAAVVRPRDAFLYSFDMNCIDLGTVFRAALGDVAVRQSASSARWASRRCVPSDEIQCIECRVSPTAPMRFGWAGMND